MSKQLIYFSAKWCEQCAEMTPMINNLKKGKTIQVATIDTDYEPSYVEQYNVRSIPTVILLENGQEAKRHVGILHHEQLQRFINS